MKEIKSSREIEVSASAKNISVSISLSGDIYDYIVGLQALERLYGNYDFDLEIIAERLVSRVLGNHLVDFLISEKHSYGLVLPELGKNAEYLDVLKNHPALLLKPSNDGTAFEKLRSERDEGEGDVPTRNPAPTMEEVTVMMELDKGEQRRLDEFAALRRKGEVVPRPDNCYTHEATLRHILRVVSFDAILDEATAYEEELLGHRKEAVSEFWEIEPSEDDEAAPDEGSKTWIAVRDASGVVREVTLDEAEEMREAAQGIYEGAPPEARIVEDRTDAYFRYLEGDVWPDTPCTGDYGLSDCLPEPSEKTLDFVDAFCVHS